MLLNNTVSFFADLFSFVHSVPLSFMREVSFFEIPRTKIARTKQIPRTEGQTSSKFSNAWNLNVGSYLVLAILVLGSF